MLDRQGRRWASGTVRVNTRESEKLAEQFCVALAG